MTARGFSMARRLALIELSVAIYLNFFSHHYVMDVRWLLFAWAVSLLLPAVLLGLAPLLASAAKMFEPLMANALTLVLVKPLLTALQLLPPRQLAVVILRDVLGFHANEVADMLSTTVDSVKSTLKRGRAGLQRRQTAIVGQEPPPVADSPVENAIVADFVHAWETADIDALVALLTDDVFMSMPPLPLEYHGRDDVRRFCASMFGAGRRFSLVPTRANGQPAFGAYLIGPTDVRHGTGVFVLALAGDRIRALTRFENGMLPSFGLPRSLVKPAR